MELEIIIDTYFGITNWPLVPLESNILYISIVVGTIHIYICAKLFPKFAPNIRKQIFIILKENSTKEDLFKSGKITYAGITAYLCINA